MSENHSNIQPGPVFYDVFLGYLRVLGINLKDWSAARGIAASNAKQAATGGWNGPRARILRQDMIDTVGRETFERLYADRMRREVA